MDDDDQPTYDLVMPFVAVQSKGGPFDDAAYCAGYEMGRLDAILAVTGEWSSSSQWTIHADNREQADLIAMRHGFTAAFDETDVPGWVQLSLSRAEDDA